MWVATASVEMVKVATEAPFRVRLDARVVELSVKLTVPVGVPEPGEVALTVAVKVTTWFRAEAFGEELTTTVLEALLIVSPKPIELLPEKFVSPV